MNSSSAKTLGIVLVILAVLMAAGLLRALILIPLGIVEGFGHGLRHWGGTWFWPWFGLTGFFGLFFLVLWIMVAVWVHGDAERRGMPGILWAVLVFFTHLLGLIIYAIVRSSKPVKREGSSSAPPAEPKPPAQGDPPAGTPPLITPAQPAACSRCGKETRPEWRGCPFCGGKI